MRRYIKIINIISAGLFISLSIALISGCDKSGSSTTMDPAMNAKQDMEDTADTGSSEDTPNSEMISKPEMTDNMSDPVDEDYDDDTFEGISRAKMDEFTSWARRPDVYGFLLSEYSSPWEADLGQAFYMGAGLGEEPSEQEIRDYLVASGNDEIFTTCIKYDGKKVRDLISRRLDCFPEELDMSGVGVYLDKYDAFFAEESDVNFVSYECTAGICNNAVYDLEFTASDDAPFAFSHIRTIVKESDGDYSIISNESLSDDTAIEVDDDIQRAWILLQGKYFPDADGLLMTDEDGIPCITVFQGSAAYSDGDIERPFRREVYFDDEDEEGYRFGCHDIYYDGEGVFGVKAQGWYWVDLVKKNVWSS